MSSIAVSTHIPPFPRLSKFFPLFVLILLSTTCSFAVWAGAFYMGITPNMVHVVTAGLIIFGVYGINRYTDLEDFLNDTSQRSFFTERKGYFYLATGALLFSILWLISSRSITVFHMVSVSFAIAYSIPLLPVIYGDKKLHWIRLKEVAPLKSLTVAVFFGSSLFALYYFDPTVRIPAPELLILNISSVLMIFCNTVFCDTRDIIGDKAVGIKTIATIFSAQKTTRYFIILPGILWSVALIISCATSLIPTSTFVLLMLLVLYPIVYITAYASKKIPDNLKYLLVEMDLPLFATGLIIVRALSPIG